jgi:Cu/Ag efflux pump CusA
MIEGLIKFSIRNRFIVLLIAAGLFGWGVYSVRTSKIDGWAALRSSSKIRLPTR